MNTSFHNFRQNRLTTWFSAWFAGVGSALDVSGAGEDLSSKERSDWSSLARDWEFVGGDFERSVDRIREEKRALDENQLSLPF